MSEESADPDQTVSRSDEIEQLRERVGYLEEAAAVMASPDRWKLTHSHCTHCKRGVIIRNGMTVRCTNCAYQSV